MSIHVFEIYQGPLKLGAANYPRPMLVVAQATSAHSPAILAISTQISTYYRPGIDFLIEKTDPDFSATGLVADSFVDCMFQIEMPPDVKRIGCLQNDLLRRFRKHYGI